MISYEVLSTDKYDELINDGISLELVWDCAAWAVWQFFKVPNKKKGSYCGIPGTHMKSNRQINGGLYRCFIHKKMSTVNWKLRKYMLRR